MKILVLAICKNEEHHVDGFINSCKGADWVAVRDTGSTDSSVAKLKEAGALVTVGSYQEVDFSKFRNDALCDVAHLPYDVVLHLDLDERLPDSWRIQVEGMVSQRGELWRKEKSGFLTPLLRVFTKHGGEWRNRVHEGFFSYSEEIMGIPPDRLNLTISHLGVPDGNKDKLYLNLLAAHPDKKFYDLLALYQGKEYQSFISMAVDIEHLSNKLQHLISRYLVVAHLSVSKTIPRDVMDKYLIIDDAHTRFAAARYECIAGNINEAKKHWVKFKQHRDDGVSSMDTYIPQYDDPSIISKLEVALC